MIKKLSIVSFKTGEARNYKNKSFGSRQITFFGMCQNSKINLKLN